MVLLPSTYLGPISYYRILAAHKVVTREGWENYVKQTYRNRCSILGANGKLDLGIPVQRTGNRKLMKDVKICNDEKWQRLHWMSIETVYRSSPYFEYYEDDLKPYYEKEYEFLMDFNTDIECEILQLLGINMSFKMTETYEKKVTDVLDYRSSVNPRNISEDNQQRYTQVFGKPDAFVSDLSIIDLLFNLGPESVKYLRAEVKRIF